MSDERLRALERAARDAAPGSPERQRWLCEHARVHGDLATEPHLAWGDVVRVVHFRADRQPATGDGWIARFMKWAETPTYSRLEDIRAACRSDEQGQDAEVEWLVDDQGRGASASRLPAIPSYVTPYDGGIDSASTP